MDKIDDHYKSLKRVYDSLEAWADRKPLLRQRILDGILTVAIVFFIVTVVPIMPILLMLFSNTIPLIIGPIDTTTGLIGSFGLIWLSLGLISAAVMLPLIWVNDKVDTRLAKLGKPPERLSPEQITFVKLYEAYDELRLFFVSYLDQHVENARLAVQSLISTNTIISRQAILAGQDLEDTVRGLPIEEGDEVALQYTVRMHPSLGLGRFAGSLTPQISIALDFLRTFDRYSWFRLEPELRAILRAFTTLPRKIPQRLRDQEELPAVLSILENMAKFSYAFLPEHETHMSTTDLNVLQSEGEEVLSTFVSQIDELTEYAPSRKLEAKDEIQRPNILHRTAGMYVSYIFVRFTVWFLMILVLTTSVLLIINNSVAISADTFAIIVIPTSVLGAIGLARITPRRSESE
ncbi:MAG: hypothetical protein J4N76_01340 [Chloroflexi bacterium]|nr:hypothetical protein [Chloroflexota bacterium]MCI0771919.1 hypothetical protein [Chloroflexota bacterium]MCI0853456.1 hypothetical protein [Chloroflexota bacterium]MCI0875193.1 hypothetical protein [Chloroflexota bacterium]MCI0890995.1 hypothetical protein [Chloroflexota bacterium]